jgi:hypothetical protein
MKKPKTTSWFSLIWIVTGFILFLNGVIDKEWIHLVAGMFMMINGEITIINYNGRETD